MNITIFGGGGFIGSTITDRLLKDGHALRIFERPRVEPYRTFLHDEQVEWVSGDFSSLHDVTAVIQGADAVFHLISTTLPKSSNDDPVYDVQSNVISTLQMLNAMVAHKVGRIVFISSGGTVYGDPVYLPIDEKHPTDPHVSYGITKLAIEKYLMLYARLHGIKPVILRVANPFGERQRVATAQGAVGVFVSQTLQGKKIEIWGDGSVTRDFVYVGDVADAFAKAATYTGPHHIFNISSGVGTSLNDLIETLEDVLNTPVMVEYKTGRGFDVPVSILCNKLALLELGWLPKVGIKEGIEQTVNWMRRDIFK